MGFLFFYWWICFLFGIWYFVQVYNPEKCDMGSEEWTGRWLVTLVSAVVISPIAWPLLLIYLYQKHKKAYDQETDIFRKQAESKMKGWNKGSGC